MVLWWIANAVGLLVVIPLVAFLANRVIREAIAADRYAGEILHHGVGITTNLDPVPALLDTATLSAEIKVHASSYVGALRRLV